MTLTEVKLFFRTVIKVVAGGPAVGTPGQNRAAGVLAALDKLADWIAELLEAAGVGTVTSVNGVAPDGAGNVELPQRDPYAVSLAKREQVGTFFTSPSQYAAPDQPLVVNGVPDTSAGYGSVFFDSQSGIRYELAPDFAGGAGGTATPTWWRQGL